MSTKKRKTVKNSLFKGEHYIIMKHKSPVLRRRERDIRMKKKALILVLSVLLLSSCGKNQQTNEHYQQSMQKAKEAIIEKKFEQAEGFVELALENKKEDGEALRLKTQLDYYNQAVVLAKEKKIKEAEAYYDKVITFKDGSKQLSEYAQKEKEALLDTDKKKEVKQEKPKEKPKEKQAEEELWTPQKGEQLSFFMADWGQTMNQIYESYQPSNNVNYYGVMLPEALWDGKMHLAVDESQVSSRWSDTGLGEEEYQIVALYSDSDTQDYVSKHVYLFAYHRGEPVVLMTQQNQGNHENNLYFKETQNQTLKEGFRSIAKGE